ncbi:PREDICTED: uncharacterized protein C227.17c isoform X2 [Tarenaya hassleriana]|uniref:uncharacterized protein C227.17c isoform X2 n=1 Tax=Tarenaya hassleriana TaxID=28532 RepID=UPI00053C3C3A|nr:PREDICTED: uncharacterized protein C227.17c isoform X2 [Tarenaya hassleriana]
MSSEKEESSSTRRRLACTPYFDALYFCYFHQMQQYYRVGKLDDCLQKFHDLFDCLSLKTKSASEVEKVLEAREKEKKHIWIMRTREEAVSHWNKTFGHLDDPNR